MAHLVENMAYVGQTPWHGLGNQLAPRQSIDVWAKQAGMDWEILDTPVRFVTGKTNNRFGEILSFDDNKVLYRSDNSIIVAGEAFSLSAAFLRVRNFMLDFRGYFSFSLVSSIQQECKDRVTMAMSAIPN